MNSDRPLPNQIPPSNNNPAQMVQPQMIEIPHSTYIQMNPDQRTSVIAPYPGYQQPDHRPEEKKYVYKYEEPKRDKADTSKKRWERFNGRSSISGDKICV